MSDEAQEYPIRTDTDIVVARQGGRTLAQQLGFASGEQIFIATAISELARNIVVYAQRGMIAVTRVEKNGRSGIEVVARDQGPGIADVGLAMQDGYSTSNSLGLGLPGTRRLMDEFEIDSRLGIGTTVVCRKWVR
jgi:serine/threonine-protein kinase RsbT